MSIKLEYSDDVFSFVKQVAHITIGRELSNDKLESNIKDLVQTGKNVSFCNIYEKLNDLILDKIKDGVFNDPNATKALTDKGYNPEATIQNYSTNIASAIHKKKSEIDRIFSAVQVHQRSHPKDESPSWFKSTVHWVFGSE